MNVITIDREFGAGGHSIGRQVAKTLGIEFYDRDIVKEAARMGGLDRATIVEEEESISRASAFIRAISPAASYDDKDAIFANETRAILKLANQGPCVILGRCAAAVLKDAGIPTLSVFLHADEESRIERVGTILELDNRAKILRAMRKRDTERAAYVACYTSSHWGDVKEYTMALDTGRLGYDACAGAIVAAASAVTK